MCRLIQSALYCCVLTLAVILT